MFMLNRRKTRKLMALALCASMVQIGLAPAWATAPTEEMDQLLELSLEDLFDVQISTASKVQESSLVAPSTVYVVTEAQIKRLGLRNLQEVLQIVPGVDTVDPHFFLLGGQRGFIGAFNQTLILVNGREMNNLIAGETFIANQFLTHNVKQVEIVNGPGSALYGANAVAGIINIITKDEDPAFEGMEATVSYGSFNTKSVGLNFAHQKQDFRLSGSLSLYASDGEDFASFLSDVERASPKAENNPYRWLPDTHGYRNDQRALYLRLRAENKGVYIGTDLYTHDTGRGTSGIQWDYNQGEDHRELWMTYAGYEKQKLFEDRLDLKLEYRYYVEKFWGNHTEGEGPLENPYTGKTTTFDTTEEDIEAYRGFYSNKRSDGSQKHVGLFESTLRLADWNTLVGGLQYEQSKVVGAAWSRTGGVHPYLDPAEQWPEYENYKWSIYGQDQMQLFENLLSLTLGARYDYHERYGDTVNPRCGLVLQPLEGSVFKLLYGKSFREPTVFEIRNSGAKIEPMTMQTVEFGWHQFLGQNLKNEMVVFYNTSDDAIVADSTEVGGTSNKGEIKAYGFEDQFSFRFGDFNGFLNYTFTKSRLKEVEVDEHDVYDIPQHKANLALMYDFGRHYSAGLITRYRGEVDTEYYDELYTISDYFVTDFTVSAFNIPWFSTETRVDLIVKNIFDQAYYAPEPRAPSVVEHPQDSCSAYVQLTLKI